MWNTIDFNIFQEKYSATWNSVLSFSVSVCIKSRSHELTLYTLTVSELIVSVPQVSIVSISTFQEEGENIIIGETGNDRFCGGSGNDILAGREGANKITGNGNDMLILGDDTTPPALPPNGSRDVLDCGPGNDSD